LKTPFSPLGGLILIVVAAVAFVGGRSTARSSSPARVAPVSGSSKPVNPTTTTGRTADAFTPAGDIAATVTRLHASVASLAQEEERQRLIEQWAETDPQAAINFALTQLRADRRAQAMAAILAFWGRNQPDAAWNWVAQNMPQATHHFDTLLEVFGKNSPALAARYAAQFAQQHPGTAVEVHLAALLGITHHGDFTGARAFIDGNPNLQPDERAVLFNFVAGQWARFAPAQAAVWVQGLPEGPLRNHALIGLGESWSDVDPAGAAAFAAQLPPGELRQLTLQQAISKWAVQDSPRANEWIVRNEPHADFDQAIAAMATGQEFIQQHLDLALGWADTIHREELRVESIGQIISNWFAHDQNAALNYLRTAANLPADKRTALLQQLESSR